MREGRLERVCLPATFKRYKALILFYAELAEWSIAPVLKTGLAGR